MPAEKNLPKLLNLIYYGFNRALPGGDLAPTRDRITGDLTTHCNQFIQYIATGYGYDKFNGMAANDMVDFMAGPGSGWISVEDPVAQEHANVGVLVVAGRKAAGHGHVCLIIPGILEKSGEYGRPVPKCVNVGKDVFIGKKVSFAFQAAEQPKYWALASMI